MKPLVLTTAACLLVMLGCSKDQSVESEELAKASTLDSTIALQADSLSEAADSLQKKSYPVGYTGKHMHGTSYGKQDLGKNAHQDLEKKFRVRNNLGKARSAGRAAYRKSEVKRQRVIKKSDD